MYIYVYTHTYIYMYTVMYVYVYTYIYIYERYESLVWEDAAHINHHACINIYICTHIFMHTCMYTHVHVHICIHTFIYTTGDAGGSAYQSSCVNIYGHICTYIYMKVCTYTYIDKYLCMHTYIQTHIYTYLYIYKTCDEEGSAYQSSCGAMHAHLCAAYARESLRTHPGALLLFVNACVHM